MNKLFVVALIAFLAIQSTESAPKSSTPIARRQQQPAPGQEESLQQTIETKTKELVKNADEFLSGNLPDSKQIISTVEEGGQKLVNGIKNFNNLIKETLKDNQGQIDTTLKQISDSLKTTRENLEKTVLGPDGQKKAHEISEAVNKAIKNTAAQIGKLDETLKPEAEKLKKELLAGADLLLEKAKQVSTDIKTRVDAAKAPTQ